jgi:sugar phosphate isomerase/epimerase
MDERIGVCSWSLQATGPLELVERVRACGLAHVQLALDPLRTGAWDAERTRDVLADAGIGVLSGMMAMQGEDYSSLASIRATGGVRPSASWPANLAGAREIAALARRLGLDLVSFHAGFLPHDGADPERRVLVERLRAVADALAAEGVATALETGQESAETLLGVLAELERDTVGVNFDPANMLLYRMGEPVESLDRLAPWVRQIHVKDAVRAPRPGEWGTEVRAGTGEVDWRAFFGVVRARGIDVDLVIEREAGDDRIGDVRAARALLDEVRG